MLLKNEIESKEAKVVPNNNYFLKLFNDEDKKLIINSFIKKSNFIPALVQSIKRDNKLLISDGDLCTGNNVPGKNNIPENVIGSISSTIQRSLISSFYFTEYNILMNYYFDYTCCGIRHFGNISQIPYKGIINAKLDVFLEDNKENFSIIDKFLLLGICSKFGNFFYSCYHSSPFSTKTEIISAIQKYLKNTFVEKDIHIRSTVATHYCRSGAESKEFMNMSTKDILNRFTQYGEVIGNQHMLMLYLENSPLFQEKNRFINANSNNLVLEYEFKFTLSDYVNQLLELLETYEQTLN